jgi:predicted amidohydrolase YtcJ
MTQPAPNADLILHRGLFTTLAHAHPTATAVAIRDGRFLAVGPDKEVMALAGPKTKVVDLKGRRVLPGLIDNHLHIIRGFLLRLLRAARWCPRSRRPHLSDIV